MSKTSPRRTCFFFATIAITSALVAGCGGAAVEPAAVEAAPSFASAEDLIDYYNTLCAESSAIDPRPVLDLYRAENDAQQRMVDVMRASIPVLELDHALWEAFGRGMNPGATASPLAPNREPARVTTSIGHRATAEYVAGDGTKGTLYLVNADGRWWLSAHTLAGRGGPEVALARVDARERMNAYIAPHAPALIARIRAGAFATQAEAGFALGEAVAREHPEVGANPELMFGDQ